MKRYREMEIDGQLTLTQVQTITELNALFKIEEVPFLNPENIQHNLSRLRHEIDGAFIDSEEVSLEQLQNLETELIKLRQLTYNLSLLIINTLLADINQEETQPLSDGSLIEFEGVERELTVLLYQSYFKFFRLATHLLAKYYALNLERLKPHLVQFQARSMEVNTYGIAQMTGDYDDAHRDITIRVKAEKAEETQALLMANGISSEVRPEVNVEEINALLAANGFVSRLDPPDANTVVLVLLNDSSFNYWQTFVR